jgi:hypothetical protein
MRKGVTHNAAKRSEMPFQINIVIEGGDCFCLCGRHNPDCMILPMVIFINSGRRERANRPGWSKPVFYNLMIAVADRNKQID